MKNILITGCSRGLGREVLSLLCTSPYPTNFVLAFRASPDSLLPQLVTSHPNHRFIYHSIDLSDFESILKFTSWFSSQIPSLSVLINNAGYGVFDDIMSKTIPDEQTIKTTLATNLYGVIRLTEGLLSNLEDDAKIVNVSALMGQLQFQSPAIKEKLINENLETKDILQLAQGYEKQMLNKEDNGWDKSSYRASKALLNSYTRFVLPKMLRKRQSCVAVCPGWCKTDMGTNKAPVPAKAGAEKIVFAMNQLGRNEYHGQFVSNNKIVKENA